MDFVKKAMNAAKGSSSSSSSQQPATSQQAGDKEDYVDKGESR